MFILTQLHLLPINAACELAPSTAAPQLTTVDIHTLIRSCTVDNFFIDEPDTIQAYLRNSHQLL
jgi:hypothetical protein